MKGFNLKKFTFVCLSNQSWDFELWTNKKQIMSRLRDRGGRVLFVDPPLRLRLLKSVFRGEISLMDTVKPRYESKGLYVFSPFRTSPFGGMKTYVPLFDSITVRWVGKVINNFFDDSPVIPPLQAEEADKDKQSDIKVDQGVEWKKPKKVLWVYHVAYPGLEKLLETVEHDILIYDAVDDYPSMPEFNKTKELSDWLIKRENWLVNKADAVFTSAPGLYKRFKSKKKNVFYTPNAGAFEMFSNLDEYDAPSDLKPILNEGKKIVGFSGAIDNYKVDVELIRAAAKAYPNYNFVIIGPLKVADNSPEVDELKALNNVKLLGKKDFTELPAYFKYFNAYYIPYNLNDYTVGGCFPTKFHDALSAGLPVIVTDLPAYEPFSNVCYIAKNSKKFIELIGKAMEEDSVEKREKRVKIASENTWDKKLNKQLEIICSL